MKGIFIAVLLSASFVSSFTAQAQSTKKNFSFGLGLEAGLLTGDVKEVYGLASGITIRGSYKVGPGFATLTTGGIALLPKKLEGEDVKAGILIPVKVGYKYLLTEHFFVMGEVGYSSLTFYYPDANDELAHETQGGFTFAPGIGAQFNAFELGLRYESTALPDKVNLSAFMLRLGLNF